MQLGMIELGRMGVSMVRRLPRGSHAGMVHDLQPSVVDEALDDFVPLLDACDIVIDGGNSYYRDDLRRDMQLQTRGIHFPDVGTSGGDAGLVAESWRRGRVIGSWLLDLTAAALLKNAQLAGYGGRVSDSGEGRWTIQAAIDEGVPAS